MPTQIKADIVIVGGGPVGLKIASILQDEFSISIIERRKEYSYQGYRVMNIESFKKWDLPRNIIEKEINKIGVVSPSFKHTLYTVTRLRGFVIDKGRLERYLKSNLGENVLLLKNTIMTQIIPNKKEIITTNRTKIKYQWLIGADGPLSKVRSLITRKSTNYKSPHYYS